MTTTYQEYEESKVFSVVFERQGLQEARREAWGARGGSPSEPSSGSQNERRPHNESPTEEREGRSAPGELVLGLVGLALLGVALLGLSLGEERPAAHSASASQAPAPAEQEAPARLTPPRWRGEGSEPYAFVGAPPRRSVRLGRSSLGRLAHPEAGAAERAALAEQLVERGASLGELRGQILGERPHRRCAELIRMVPRLDAPAAERLELLRAAAGHTLLLRAEVKRPAQLFAQLRALSRRSGVGGALWAALPKRAQRLAQQERPSLAALGVVVEGLREVQRGGRLATPEALAQLGLGLPPYLAGEPAGPEDTVGIALQRARGRRLLEALLPALPALELAQALRPRTVGAASLALAELAGERVPGAAQLLLDCDHVQGAVRAASLGRLPGYDALAALTRRLLSGDPAARAQAACSIELRLRERPQDARHLRHALALSQRQLWDLAEAHEAAELTSLALVCQAAGEEGEQVLRGWRSSRSEALRELARSALGELSDSADSL